MKQTHLTLLLGTSFALALAGCSNAKESLGLNRSAPDEFMVVKHAPLSMPPDYNLVPPAPGAPRPQEQSTNVAAKKTIFGTDAPGAANTAPSNAEELLLQQAGTAQANPDIRRVVDQETAELKDRNKTVADKVLGLEGDKPSARIVNAKQESQRLQANQAEGKPVTEGETPTIEE